MKVLIYPETQNATIGCFDEPGVETCAMILGAHKDLDLIERAFELCDLLQSPVNYVTDILDRVCQIYVQDGDEVTTDDHLEIVIRITRKDLLSFVPEEDGDPFESILGDVRNLALTANELMEVSRTDRRNTWFPDDVLSVLGCLAETLELILLGAVPLADRFDILESDDELSVGPHQKIIDSYMAQL